MSRKEKEANFWMKFVVNDWLADPHLSACAPATRGIWMDVICNLHNMRQPLFAAFDTAWARMCRATPEEVRIAFYELHVSGTAVVEEVQGIFTIASRRMLREMEISGIRREAVAQRADRKPESQQQMDEIGSTKSVQNPNSNSSFNSASQDEVQEKETPTPPSPRRVPNSDEVDAVRMAYPLKVAPEYARKAIRKAVDHLHSGKDRPAMSTSEALEFLQKQASAFARSPAGKGDFVPYPATWFNRGSYLEDSSEWQRSGDGTDRQQQRNGQQQGTRTAAQQRNENGNSAILGAWSDIASEAGAGDVGYPDEGELPVSGSHGGDGRPLARGLDGDDAGAWTYGPGGSVKASSVVIEIPAMPRGHRGADYTGSEGAAYATRC